MHLDQRLGQLVDIGASRGWGRAEYGKKLVSRALMIRMIGVDEQRDDFAASLVALNEIFGKHGAVACVR